MACDIANNGPLQLLRKRLGVPEHCHSSLRLGGCHHHLAENEDMTAVRGGMGAVLGWCQALFPHKNQWPADHTEYISAMLTNLNAFWPKSQEIYYGHRPPAMSATDFLTQAMRPLLGAGRIPVIITSFDASQVDEVSEIVGSNPPIAAGETVLVRLLLTPGSIAPAVKLVEGLIEEAGQLGQMPKFWPLFQGVASTMHNEWSEFLELLGNNRQFINIAINPFSGRVPCFLAGDQIVVAQVPIGLADGMEDNGTIKLAPGMSITDAAAEESYNLFRYAEMFNCIRSGVMPTVIVLGPSLPQWTEQMNFDRVKKANELVGQMTQILWKEIPSSRREEVLGLPA